MSGIYWSSMPTNVRLATLLSATITGKGVEPSVYTLDENARMYLYLKWSCYGKLRRYQWY